MTRWIYKVKHLQAVLKYSEAYFCYTSDVKENVLKSEVDILKYSADTRRSLAHRQQCQIGQSRTHQHLLINFLIYYSELEEKSKDKTTK